MFAHFRHSEKTRITPESLPPTGQPITKPPPTPLPFSPPPPPAAEVPAQSPSLSESFSSFIKTILSVSASTFLKPSNISIAVTPDRRVTLESTHNSSFEVSYEAPTQAPPASTPSSVSVGLIAGITVAAILVLFILGVIFIYFIRKKKPSRPVPKIADNLYSPKLEGARSSMEKEQRGTNGNEFYRGAQQQQAQPMQAVVVEMARGTYTFDELSKATNGFSQDSVLGQGGFGQVFKGLLNGMEVAVKKLKTDGSQGDKEFRAEVDIISRVHHKNLVSLVGHCIYQDQRLLVYEFVSNKTLDFHLRGNGEVTLNWQNRYKIALGAAKGLAYLHEDCDPKIIHRDIKASNILLDLSFEAKVADFGLAKYQQTNETHVTTRVMGTFGYIAPEFATSGRLTEKADVYAFGVVLLEIITGKGPYDSHMDESLVGWARPLLDRALDDGEYDGLVDSRLGSNYDSYGMQRMMQCASAAVRQTYRRRPAMIQLVQHLQGEILAEDLNAGMTPGHSSAISSFGFGPHSSDFNSGNKRYRAGLRDYASSEFSDLSSNQNTVTSETHEKLAR